MSSEIEMDPGEVGSINCTVENKTSELIELVMQCSGLESTGIECYINGEYLIERAFITGMADVNFSVLLVSSSSPPVPAGSYPFFISVDDCTNSDLC
jgi:hypothetical protein